MNQPSNLWTLKAFLRYHDPENSSLLREALNRMGRSDLIVNNKRHLVPRFQPEATGKLLQCARGLRLGTQLWAARSAQATAKKRGG